MTDNERRYNPFFDPGDADTSIWPDHEKEGQAGTERPPSDTAREHDTVSGLLQIYRVRAATLTIVINNRITYVSLMPESNQTVRRFALAGIFGPIVWWSLIVINGAITPGYSHVSDFISALGAVGAPYAFIQQINFVIFGGSVLALAVGLHSWFGDGRRPPVATALVGVFGLGVILAAVFPQNPAAPDSFTDTMHTGVSIVAFLAGVSGVSLVTRRLRIDDRWPTYRYEPAGTAIIVLVTFVVSVATVIIESSVLGITQRLFIGVMSLWVLLQSLRLYRVAGESERFDPGEEANSPDVDTVG